LEVGKLQGMILATCGVVIGELWRADLTICGVLVVQVEATADGVLSLMQIELVDRKYYGYRQK
jgi:hypothetical protein